MPLRMLILVMRKEQTLLRGNKIDPYILSLKDLRFKTVGLICVYSLIYGVNSCFYFIFSSYVGTGTLSFLGLNSHCSADYHEKP